MPRPRPTKTLSAASLPSSSSAPALPEAVLAEAPAERIMRGDLNPFAVLGLTPHASDEEVRKTFHSLAKILHLDRVRRLGIHVATTPETENVVARSHERFVEISEPATLILGGRGDLLRTIWRERAIHGDAEAAAATADQLFSWSASGLQTGHALFVNTIRSLYAKHRSAKTIASQTQSSRPADDSVAQTMWSSLLSFAPFAPRATHRSSAPSGGVEDVEGVRALSVLKRPKLPRDRVLLETRIRQHVFACCKRSSCS